MANVIKLHKGLDIHLQGKAEEKLIQLKSNGQYALVPDDFEGVTPKVVVKEGDVVKAGDALFVNKHSAAASAHTSLCTLKVGTISAMSDSSKP